jgi:hypothetical protein
VVIAVSVTFAFECIRNTTHPLVASALAFSSRSGGRLNARAEAFCLGFLGETPLLWLLRRSQRPARPLHSPVFASRMVR